MFSWAIAWTNAKIVNEYLSTYNLVFLRFLLGALCLLPFVVKKKIKLKNLSITWPYLISASLLFFLYNICFFKGTYYGYAGKGAVFVTTINPIITFIIMLFIKRKIYFNEFFGILLGILGGACIMGVFNNGMQILFEINNIYFVLCAFIWGTMTVIINYGLKKTDPLIFIFLCYLITTIFSFPLSDFKELNLYYLDSRFYLNFLLVSVGAMSFGTSIYMFSTTILGPVKASVFIFSVPFIALGTAYVFLNEPIFPQVVIGGMLSLLSIYVVNKNY